MKIYLVIPILILFSTEAYGHAGHEHAAEENTGLSINGFLEFQAGITSQDIDVNRNEPGFADDTEIDFIYSKRNDYGITYGAVIELEADVTEDARGEGFNADKTFLFLQNAFGRLELGSNFDAADLLSVDAASFARATGGIHGDWDLYTEFPAAHDDGHAHRRKIQSHIAHEGAEKFIHAPALPLHEEHEEAEDATKISYYTPKIEGLQFGVSYIPDSGDVGQIFSGKTGHQDFNDAVAAGLLYSGEKSDFTYALSLAGETGRSELPGHEDLQAYSSGINLGYQNFVFGGSYGNWGESLTHSSPDNKDSYYWTLGTAYVFNNAGISLTYLKSDFQGNQLENLSLGADYTVLPGFTPYIELSLVDLDAENPDIEDNRAQVLIVGTQLNF